MIELPTTGDIPPSTITAIRQRASMSVRKCAELAGVEPSTWSRWEKGRNRATGLQRDQLMKVLRRLQKAV